MDMLQLEWIIRLFSIFMAVLLSVLLNPLDAFLLTELFFWVSLSYALLLLFKKYLYIWPLGSHYNLIIESLELMVLLYIHSAILLTHGGGIIHIIYGKAGHNI